MVRISVPLTQTDTFSGVPFWISSGATVVDEQAARADAAAAVARKSLATARRNRSDRLFQAVNGAT
jgi:hypothetical protein